jgi:hypothetical protein
MNAWRYRILSTRRLKMGLLSLSYGAAVLTFAASFAARLDVNSWMHLSFRRQRDD